MKTSFRQTCAILVAATRQRGRLSISWWQYSHTRTLVSQRPCQTLFSPWCLGVFRVPYGRQQEYQDVKPASQWPRCCNTPHSTTHNFPEVHQQRHATTKSQGGHCEFSKANQINSCGPSLFSLLSYFAPDKIGRHKYHLLYVLQQRTSLTWHEPP